MAARKNTALFIRDFLKKNGTSYISEMYKAYKKYCKENGWYVPSE